MNPAESDLGAWLRQLEKLHPKVVDLGLERISLVLERLGLIDPEFKVITVAGTNGKGSTVAMLESLLRGAGRSVAALTSSRSRSSMRRWRSPWTAGSPAS